jgi:hypothetical protein
MAVNVLALRAAGLGDLLTAVPALRSLASFRVPGAGHTHVVVAAPAWLHPIVRLIPGVCEAADVAGMRPVVSARPTLAVNLHGSGPQSHEALLAVRPRQLLAYRQGDLWPSGPIWIHEESERVRWCRLLEWIGLPTDANRVGINRPSTPPAVANGVVLHLGASGPERRWPASSFAELAAGLADERLVLTGTLQDLPAAIEVAKAGRIPPQRQLVGWLDLPALASTIAASRLVVTGDTGVAHLATAYGVPSVIIFGPASVKRWGPPELDRHRVVRAGGRAPQASDVPVEVVAEQVHELLSLPYRSLPAPRHPAVLSMARPQARGAVAARAR